MADTRIKIVFTHVDATFVCDDHHAIAASAPAVRAVASHMPLCLVSARSPEGLYPIQRDLGFTGPLACFSGAYVLSEQGDELFSRTISLEDALELRSWLARELPQVSVGTYGFHTWIVDDRSDPRIAREEYLVQTQSRECHDLASAFDERGVHKFLLMGDPDDIRMAQQMVASHFENLTAVRSSDILCEVMASGVSKSHAVEVLCDHYGVQVAEAAGFGDGPNDIDMLEAVGHSFAMANAEEEVKQAASQVVPWTNAECGVARMFEQLGLTNADA